MTTRCAAEIRAMIVRGELLPGQKVHQRTLSEMLNVSRIPVREALSTLTAEGMLVHRPNTGYTVARFDRDDLSEIYTMRRLLETELLRTAVLEEVDLARLASLNDHIHEARVADDSEQFLDANRQFHFAIFETSPATLICSEVGRLWDMSEVYRTLYVAEDGVRESVEKDHAHIIKLIKAGDNEALVAAHDEHRGHTEGLILYRLTRSRPAKR
jgi:DNA-binding GntR family transcriptional regulator